MEKDIERRRHLRAPLTLTAIIETSHGKLEGKTADISVSGLAVILFLEKPEIGNTFDITIISSENHEMLLTCEKVWSGKIISDETLYDALGVEFIEITPNDRKIIASMVKQFYLV